MSSKSQLIVIGNGMVGHKLVESLHGRGGLDAWDVTVFCEEPRLAYDRVNLSQIFAGKTAEDLTLARAEIYQKMGLTVWIGDRAVEIDRASRLVRSAAGRALPYDRVVLATGSYPFVPPMPGRDLPGCFVYRTIDDLERIRAYAAQGRTGAVIGGGLLGLEAANVLRQLGLTTHVVELSPRLMATQLDEPGAQVLRGRIEELGVCVHTGRATREVIAADGRAAGLRFADGEELAADLVVFAAGIRPRDELGRQAGLAMGPRGGIAIDERCQTSDRRILAVGECALYEEMTFGLVGPGYRMAEVAVDALLGGDGRFTGADLSTKLKLLGVDVGSFGDAFGRTPGARTVTVHDTVADVYKKLVISADRKRILGGMLVGDAAAYARLTMMMQSGMAVPPQPQDLLVERSGAAAPGHGVEGLPGTAMVCNCHNVTKELICGAIARDKLTAVGGVKACTKAGTGCGSCVPLVTEILHAELKRAGVTVVRRLCEHFNQTRQELFHLVRFHELRSFEEVLQRHGTGAGCEICKPAVASILASTWNEHVLDRRLWPLQDTNDRFMANVQRDGTYSIVPRVPGGEITPEKLIALGEVARKHGLYSKITGAQRVDLFGARLEQLPQVWSDLIAAGFESGHAYGKALRTVKSCVGSTWCRFGQQDSVTMAITLENRYKGLRAPHKLKGAASGCARECAEAQGKDFGVIATEKGYNLYVCGNGGMKPQHAQLLAADLDQATVLTYCDRFLMFYVRTADRLERTATWFNKLEGGIEYLRQVIIEDSLGICAELESDMQRVIDSYRCEWKAALDDPEKMKMFRPFVNTAERDPSIVFIRQRDQHRPASWREKSDGLEDAI
jgi:nitrite reductase (NADH) large subunit